MKQNRGAAGLLILVEMILLIAAVVLGTVHKLAPEEQRKTPVALSTEQTDSFMENNTEDVTDVRTEEADTVLTENFSAEVAEKMASMTTEEKVAQLFVVSPEELTGNELVNIAGAGTKSAIDTYPIGGLVYKDRNYQGREQFRDLIRNAEQYSHERIGCYLFLAVQGENADGSGAAVMSQSYDAAPLVEMMAANLMTGENILPLSVFPEQRETITPEMPWVMLSNQSAVGIADAPDVPCSFSKEAVAELRNTMDYHGVILTGNLSEEMVTAGYSAAEAAVLAVQAGADMLYCPSGFTEAYQAVLDAVGAGEIAEEQLDRAVGHILTQKYAMPEPVFEEVTGENTPNQTAQTANANNANTGNNTANNPAGNTIDNAAAANAGNNAGDAGNDANAGNDAAANAADNAAANNENGNAGDNGAGA